MVSFHVSSYLKY